MRGAVKSEDYLEREDGDAEKDRQVCRLFSDPPLLEREYENNQRIHPKNHY